MIHFVKPHKFSAKTREIKDIPPGTTFLARWEGNLKSQERFLFIKAVTGHCILF